MNQKFLPEIFLILLVLILAISGIFLIAAKKENLTLKPAVSFVPHPIYLPTTLPSPSPKSINPSISMIILPTPTIPPIAAWWFREEVEARPAGDEPETAGCVALYLDYSNRNEDTCSEQEPGKRFPDKCGDATFIFGLNWPLVKPQKLTEQNAPAQCAKEPLPKPIKYLSCNNYCLEEYGLTGFCDTRPVNCKGVVVQSGYCLCGD